MEGTGTRMKSPSVRKLRRDFEPRKASMIRESEWVRPT